MGNKTAIVILVVAASLLGFIFLFERDTMTTDERNARKGRVFNALRKEAITELTLKGVSGQSVTVKKLTDEAEVEEKWQITAPKKLPADKGEVRAILSALDFLLVDRAVHGEDKVKDASFALETPRITGAITQRGESVSFRVGADAQGEKVYFALSTAPDTVYAVSSDIVDSLNKDIDDLRSKDLVEEALSDVTKAVFERPLGTVSLEKRDDFWQIRVGDTWIPAAADQAKALVRLVSDAEAMRFEADDVSTEALAAYGLDNPNIAIRLTDTEADEVSLLIGKPCDEDGAARFVTVAKSGTVACAKDDFGVVAERPLLRFQETRPIPVASDDIAAVTIARDGDTLSMKLENDKWVTGDGVAVDAETLDGALKLLTDSQAAEIAVGDAAVASLKGEETTVTVTLADDMGTRTVSLFKDGEAQTRVRREDENAVLTVPGALGQVLVPDLLAFRSRQILNEDADHVEKLVIRGTTSQTIEKQDGTWQIIDPIRIAADSGAVRKLAELMTGLTVTDFVPEKIGPKHGFTKPFAIIEARLAEHHHGATKEEGTPSTDSAASRTIVLELGNETDEGRRYGRLKEDPATLFVVGDDFEYAVRRPLIARDVVQIDDTAVVRVTIAEGDDTHEISRENGIWKRTGKAPLDEAAFKKILADLGGVKIVGADSFGATRALAPPLIELTFFENEAQETTALTIGTGEKDPYDTGYLARKSGIDATFILPTRLVDDIRAFTTGE